MDQYIKNHWVDGLSHLLRIGDLSNHQLTEAFEQKLAEYCDCEYAVVTNSGTNAIFVAMKVYGVKSIVGPAYGNTAWISCCRFLGIEYDTIDVRLDNFCLDEKLLKDYLLFRKPDAVVYINHGGYTGPQLESIKNICDLHKVTLFEDSCNALGQRYNGKQAGTFGDIGFISFSIPKIISCGEGGAILTNNEKIYRECKKMVYHGGWYQGTDGLGLNFSMPVHNAYFLLEQLNDIDSLLERREEMCTRFENNGIKLRRFHQAPSIFEYETKNIEKILEKFKKFRIDAVYKNYKNRHIEKNNAKYIRNNTIIIPNHIGITDEKIDLTSSIIKMGEK